MRQYCLIIFAVVVCISMTACSTQPIVVPTPTPLGISADPAQAYLEQGDQASGTNNYDQVIIDYTLAIQINPYFAEAYNNRGLAYALKSKNQIEKAIADYNQAIELRSDYAYAFNNRGVAYMASGHPEEALSDFNHAILLNPGFSQAHSNRGNYYFRSGQ